MPAFDIVVRCARLRGGSKARQDIAIGGGNIGYEGGFLPIKIPGLFPNGLPAIATAAVMGIVMNLVFISFKPSAPPRVQPKAAIP